MIRLLLFLLGKTGFDTCESCATLRAQLVVEKAEKKELLDTIMNLVKPKVIEQPTTNIEPIKRAPAIWGRRAAMLSENSRAAAAAMKPMRGVPGVNERIVALETELEIQKGTEDASKVGETLPIHANGEA